MDGVKGGSIEERIDCAVLVGEPDIVDQRCLVGSVEESLRVLRESW